MKVVVASGGLVVCLIDQMDTRQSIINVIGVFVNPYIINLRTVVSSVSPTSEKSLSTHKNNYFLFIAELIIFYLDKIFIKDRC